MQQYELIVEEHSSHRTSALLNLCPTGLQQCQGIVPPYVRRGGMAENRGQCFSVSLSHKTIVSYSDTERQVTSPTGQHRPKFDPLSLPFTTISLLKVSGETVSRHSQGKVSNGTGPLQLHAALGKCRRHRQLRHRQDPRVPGLAWPPASGACP